MPVTDSLLFLLLLLGGWASAAARKLTWPAAATGVVLGCLIYKGGGWNGILLLATFFVLGTLATSRGMRQKQQLGLAEQRGGRRNAGQVWANAGAAGMLGVLVWLVPEREALFRLMMAGCFSAAAADTLSSELGNLYGRRFYHILSLRSSQRGPDGVVSLEGTCCGVLGSLLIAAIYVAGNGWSNHFYRIVLAGTIGNLADSVLGATVERRGWLGNNAVNFLNTLAGGLACVL